MSVLMLRAQRTAKRVPQGEEILAFLTSAKSRKAMVKAAAEGLAPVTAITKAFVEITQAKNRQLMQVRQFVGLSIRAIMEEEGFEIDRTGVWLGDDPVFSTAATYRKLAKGSRDRDFLTRFAEMLTKEEATILQSILIRRLER